MKKSIGFIFSFLAYACAIALACACEPAEDSAVKFSIKYTNVSNGEGGQTVSIKTAEPWKLRIDVEGLEVGESADWVWVNPSSGTGSRLANMGWKANGTGEARGCTLILSTGGQDYTINFVQAGDGVGPAGVSRSELPNKIREDKVPGWMEIPVVDDRLCFITHEMQGGLLRTRNYSIGLDTTALVSVWVAYPQNKLLAGTSSTSGGRHFSGTSYWQGTFDPKVPARCQAITEWPFRGYERGHQVASADRYFSSDANFQTFYGTNMTPQNGALNENAWAALEDMVRVWSRSLDTLYVVTGADIKGSTKKVADNDGKQVTVPVGYFKALLGYKQNKSIGREGYTAIAFYYPNSSDYSTDEASVMSHSMSIDDLEKKVGFDFFPNLKNRIASSTADAIEASANSWKK